MERDPAISSEEEEEEEGVRSRVDQGGSRREGRSGIGHQAQQSVGSVSLSLSLDSQPPGPSGINLQQLTTALRRARNAVTEGSAADPSSRSSEERANGNVPPLVFQVPPPVFQVPPPVFQVPPSQDLLMDGISSDSYDLDFSAVQQSTSQGGAPSSSTATSSHQLVPQHISNNNNDPSPPVSSLPNDPPPLVSYLHSNPPSVPVSTNSPQGLPQALLAAAQTFQHNGGSQPPPPPPSSDRESDVYGSSTEDEMRGEQEVFMKIFKRGTKALVRKVPGNDISFSSDDGIRRAVQAATLKQRINRLSGLPESSLTTTRVMAAAGGEQEVHVSSTSDTDISHPKHQKVPALSTWKILELEKEAKKRSVMVGDVGAESESSSRSSSHLPTSSLGHIEGSNFYHLGDTRETEGTSNSLNGSLSPDATSLAVPPVTLYTNSSEDLVEPQLIPGGPSSDIGSDTSCIPGTQTTSSSNTQHSPSPHSSPQQQKASKMRPQCTVLKKRQRASSSVDCSSEIEKTTSRNILRVGGENSASQSVHNIQSQDDYANQLPRWCMEETPAVSSQRLSKQDSSSSSDQSSSSKPPPPKRRKDKSRSSSVSDIPRWQRDGSTNSAAGGMSGQAQPMQSLPLTTNNKVAAATNSPPLLSPQPQGSGNSDSSVQLLSSPNSGSSGQSTEGAIRGTPTISITVSPRSSEFKSPDQTMARIVDPSSGNEGGISCSPSVSQQSAIKQSASVSTAELLKDPIFEGAESSDDSDIDIGSPGSLVNAKQKKENSGGTDSIIDSPPLLGGPKLVTNAESEHKQDDAMEDNLSYMDEETQPLDSPELIDDIGNSHGVLLPLESPVKDESSNAMCDSEAMEVNLIVSQSQPIPLQLELTQSQTTQTSNSGKINEGQNRGVVTDSSLNESEGGSGSGSEEKEGGSGSEGRGGESGGGSGSEGRGGGSEGRGGGSEDRGGESEGGGGGSEGRGGGNGSEGGGNGASGDGGGGGGSGGGDDRRNGGGSKDEDKREDKETEQKVKDKSKAKSKGDGDEGSHENRNSISLCDIVKTKEPLYESLKYDDSVDDSHLSAPATTSLQLKYTDRVIISSGTCSNSQQSEISSGTPFQFQLPHDSLLQPRITPPPPSSRSSSQLVSTVAGKPQSEKDNSVSASSVSSGREESFKIDVGNVTISPSEVRQDFFRPITPNSTQVRHVSPHSERSTESGGSSSSEKSHQLVNCEVADTAVAPNPKSCGTHSTPTTPLLLANSSRSSPSSRKACSLSLSSTVKRKLMRKEGADLSGTEHARKGFLMGINVPVEHDSIEDLTSSLSLPHIEVAESQFDASVDSIDVKKPTLNRSTSDDAEERGGAEIEANKSVFSDTMASDSKRHKMTDKPGNTELPPTESAKVCSTTPIVTVTSLAPEQSLSLDLSKATTASFSKPPTTLSISPINGKSDEKISSTSSKPSNLSPTATSSTGRASNSPKSSSTVPTSRLSPGVSTSLSSPRLTSLSSPRLPMATSLSSPRLPRPSLPSPLSSVATNEFVSPSKNISREGYQELKRQITEQLGVEAGAYELCYVRTVCTVIEERFISSELIESDKVVPGSKKAWPESSRPYTTQEVKVELRPRTSASCPSSSVHPLPSIVLSPFSHRVSSPIPGSHSHFRLPMSTTHHHGHLLPSPSSTSFLQSPLSTSHYSSSMRKSNTSTLSAIPRQESPIVGGRGIDSSPPKNTSGKEKGDSSSSRRDKGNVDCTEGNDEDISLADFEEAPLPLSTPPHTPLPLSTPPRRRGNSKASAKLSLASKTKVSPRKNIWAAENSKEAVRSDKGKRCLEAAGESDISPQRKKLRLDPLKTSNSEGVSRSRRSLHLDGNSESEHASDSPGIGQTVIARWMTDKRWYAATVKNISKSGRFLLDYADGEKGSVTLSQLFLQSRLEKNEPVVAGECEDENEEEISGVFVKFHSNGKKFSLMTSSGKTVICDLGRFSISQDTASKYIKHTRPSPSTRKRLQAPHGKFTSPSESSKRRRIISPNNSLSSTGENDVTIEDLITPSQSFLFQGYTFMLTQKPKEDKQSSTPDDTTINKQQITSQIVHRKGRVLETYNSERIDDGRFFILSDDCCRTQKYLLGLALAIPCVSYTWIKDCIDQGDVLDYSLYRLPAGVPNTGISPIEWVPRERSSVLKGVRVYVHHRQNKYKENWNSIANYSGATVLSKLPSSNKVLRSHHAENEFSGITVICEKPSKLPSSISSRVDLNIKVLTQEWIIQCLIQGRPVDNYTDFMA